MTSQPIVDDKSPICVPFILDRLKEFQAKSSSSASSSDQDGHPARRPFIVGINGVQGVGKTTLVSTLAHTLQHDQGLETLVVSIDDFYLTHHDQRALAAAHPDNKLVQVRGEPGTHDTRLLQHFFDAVCEGRPAHVPSYDKAAFAGQGDRVAPMPAVAGRLVNGPAQKPLQVVIVEGWCVAFRPITPEEVESRWKSSAKEEDITDTAAGAAASQLPHHKLDHLLFVNSQLAAYDAALTDRIDAMIHLDAEQTPYVYGWRREQEAALRRERGTGMTDEEVDRFVDAYYPAYELFADGVRRGIFTGRDDKKKGHQLRLIVGRDRRVKESIVI